MGDPAFTMRRRPTALPELEHATLARLLTNHHAPTDEPNAAGFAGVAPLQVHTCFF